LLDDSFTEAKIKGVNKKEVDKFPFEVDKSPLIFENNNKSLIHNQLIIIVFLFSFDKLLNKAEKRSTCIINTTLPCACHANVVRLSL